MELADLFRRNERGLAECRQDMAMAKAELGDEPVAEVAAGAAVAAGATGAGGGSGGEAQVLALEDEPAGSGGGGDAFLAAAAAGGGGSMVLDASGAGSMGMKLLR